MSKADLARKAGVSPLTIQRAEQGKYCRMETKRKLVLALVYSLSEKGKIFPEDQIARWGFWKKASRVRANLKTGQFHKKIENVCIGKKTASLEAIIRMNEVIN